ncbi:MAG: DEAD/DEAH box helicase [Spirochaetes bacterium]|nr:DEAD/DEAH box helicase [Spirochaetota bacterium]
MSFTEFNLSNEIGSQIKAMGYNTPTHIQKRAIPLILQGKDVMGLAQTGTGKTAAFALPILQRLSAGKRGQVRALIIAPTRELAEQINESISELGRRTGLKSTAIYGGVNAGRQVRALARGVDIVVACPGRLLDHLKNRGINLSHLETLVLDEADHMFDMGFLPDIRRILAYASTRKQTLLFSATMPKDIRKLADDILKDPCHITIDHETPLETVEHVLFPVPQHLKTGLLLELLKTTDTKSILIFTRTKHRAETLDQKLKRSGYRVTSLQGNLSQGRRQKAIEGFRDGTYQIMVATDIAARGIDVSLISHVINYDIPDTPDAYTHRIGRTGRAERSGDAFTFITNEDAAAVRDIERKMGVTIKRRRIDGFDYTAPKNNETPKQQTWRSFQRKRAS